MAPGPTQSSVQCVLGAFFAGTKQLGHEADISPPSNVKIMNMLNYMTSIPDNLWKPSHSNRKFTCMCCWHLTCRARQDLELCPLPVHACEEKEGKRVVWLHYNFSYTDHTLPLLGLWNTDPFHSWVGMLTLVRTVALTLSCMSAPFKFSVLL